MTKNIQYIIPMEYDKDKSLEVISTLFLKLLQTVNSLKDKGIKYTPKEFAIYPINLFEQLKLKKIIMSGKDRGVNLLDAVDEMFLEELTKENLKVRRDQNEIK